MKSSKSNARWAPAPCRAQMERPARAEPQGCTDAPPRAPHPGRQPGLSPSLLYGFTVNCYFVPGLHNFEL